MRRVRRLAAPAVLGLVLLVALGVPGQAAAQQGPRLTIGLSAEPTTLDPHLSGEIPAHNIARNIFDALLFRDEGMRLTGGLAESWRLVNPTTYQFKLRRGVKFHNGEPFNAEAVKFSIERQLNHAKSRAKAALAPVEKVEVVDEYTVNVVSKGPFPVLLARMTYAGSGSVVMLPPKYVQEKGDDFAAHPIGTGPFKFVEWVKGDRVTLEANPDYWRGKPRVQRVTFRFVPETATRIASLLNGETDIIENVPPDQVERVAGSPNAVVGKTSDGMIVAYYQFDTRADSPVKNRKVREAINHAIDWDTIVKDLLRGHARRRPVPLDPGDLGMNPGVKTFAYDPEKAKKLLAEAGYPNGFAFTMPTSNGRYMEDRAVTEAIAAYLGKVGIKATVQPTEWGVYLKMLAEKRTGPVFIIGWGSGLFDADVLVDEFGCKVTYSTYCNEQVEELIQKARSEANPEARVKLYHRAQELLVEDAAFAGAYQPAALFGISKKVDWKPTIGELIFLWNAGVR
jgi:peptide/nickel transport system substrate-binding protein